LEITKKEINLINQLLSDQIGISISTDKSNMLELRLSKRIKELQLVNIKQYINYIEENNDEKIVLYNLLTTNYTKFFREEYQFDSLMRKIIPDLIKTKKEIKIWSAGCSTGEEPYTIAMILDQNFDKENFDFKVLATDINTEVLKTASKGIYSKNKIKNIDSDYLYRYFQKGVGKYKGYYKVKENIREKIKFQSLNLNTLFSQKFSQNFDMIFCRNVLIYFDDRNKRKVVKEFERTLNDYGYLILGHSESLKNNGNHKISLKKTDTNIYQKQK
jgi:chemotaxis protein methyltransferase CheR